MKQLFIAYLLCLAFGTVIHAQTPPADGGFQGLTREIAFDRMVPAYNLEVSFEKTTHIIFPSAIKYVDLGSSSIIAGKAGGAENVLHVKTAVRKVFLLKQKDVLILLNQIIALCTAIVDSLQSAVKQSV
jgi:hypothetical protein